MRGAWRWADVVLVCDTEARSTVDNARNVAAAARELGAKELVVVTSRWHRLRAGILLKAALRGSGIRVRSRRRPVRGHSDSSRGSGPASCYSRSSCRVCSAKRAVPDRAPGTTQRLSACPVQRCRRASGSRAPSQRSHSNEPRSVDLGEAEGGLWWPRDRGPEVGMHCWMGIYRANSPTSSNVTVPEAATSVGANPFRTTRTWATPAGIVTACSSVWKPTVVNGAVTSRTVCTTCPSAPR